MKCLGLKISLTLFLLSSCFIILASPADAADINQQILDLRKQVEELEKKSEEYQKAVSSKQKEAQTLKREIEILNNQIYKLETQIKITGGKINIAKINITDLRSKIFDRQEAISKKREVVASLINLLYKKDQEDIVDIVIKNKHLSDFIDQVKQADNLNKNLLSTIMVLKNEKEELESNKNELETQKQELETLNSVQKNKQNALDSTKDGKGNLLTKTKGQEAAYQKLLDEVEKKKEEFFDELKKLEAQALQSGAFIVRVTADSIPKKGSKIFKWPEDDFRLTQGYGCTVYARCGRARGPYGGAPHNGIDIASGYGSAIRPVMSGAILASGFNSSFGNWVAVRHEGNLVSVYAHMQSPSGLANGFLVATESIIGYEGDTGYVTGSHLHLSVYKDFFTYINDKNGQLYFNYFDGSLNPLDYL